MKIESATVALASQQTSVAATSVKERMRMWVGNNPPPERDDRAASGASMLVTLSAAARSALSSFQSSVQTQAGETPAPSGAVPTEAADPDAIDSDPKLQLLARMLELMTGRRVKTLRASDLRGEPDASADKAKAKAAPASQASAASGNRVGWGFSYDRTERHYEAQTTRFAAEGVVHTADGQTIRFAVAVSMERTYYSESSVSIRAGDAVVKDPLVINFSGTAADLSDLRFDFDLDADGQTENAAFVGAGSGFLALDRNGNGTVDDGRELFGALSGDGFADLAALDADGNGWIDESDPAFAQLLVWQKDAQGNDRLRGLSEAGVGALYLGRVDSPFSVRDANNQAQAEVRSTGVYLMESGAAGTLQQVDLVV